jgi:hypothetical protein
MPPSPAKVGGEASAAHKADIKTATPSDTTDGATRGKAFAGHLARAQGDATSRTEAKAKKHAGKAKSHSARTTSTTAEPSPLRDDAAAGVQAAPVTDAQDMPPAKVEVTEAPIAASIQGLAGVALATGPAMPGREEDAEAVLTAAVAKPIAANAPNENVDKDKDQKVGVAKIGAGRKAAATKPSDAPAAKRGSAAATDDGGEGTQRSSRPGLHAPTSLNDANIVVTAAKAPPGLTLPATTAGAAAKTAPDPTTAVAADPADASDAVTKLRMAGQTKATPTKTTTATTGAEAASSSFTPGGTESSDGVEATLPTQHAAALDIPDPVDPATAPGQHRADITIGEGQHRIVVSVLASEQQVRVHARTASGDDTSALRAGADELRGALRKHGLELAYLNAETSDRGSTATGSGPQRDAQKDQTQTASTSRERRTTENPEPASGAETKRSDVRVLA